MTFTMREGVNMFRVICQCLFVALLSVGPGGFALTSPLQAGEKAATLEYAVPEFGIRQEDLAPTYGVMTYLWVRMPQVESEWNILDMQMYEEPHDLEFLGQRKLDNGVLELRHRRRTEPYWIMITEITPAPGKLSLVARGELDPDVEGKHELPDALPELNVCCTFDRSRDAFDIIPDPFPEFSTRSFIFTEKGSRSSTRPCGDN
ncbi:MAG: hypothetical protein ACKVT0_15495 [Planctomycetaceae bacterium]